MKEGGLFMKKTLKIALLCIFILIILLIVIQCKDNDKLSKNKQAAPQDTLLFGLATGLGGLGDKAFNDMHFKGMTLAQQKYNIKYIYDTPLTIEDDIEVIEGLINKGANVIIAGGGYHMIEPVDILAKKYPKVKFIVMDDVAHNYYDNVASIQFRQNEGSFLVGALCAMESKTKAIAMIGAININIINDFNVGFIAGAKYINPNINIYTEYIADYDKISNPFDNSKVARQIANKLYQTKNVDIIFQVAAGAGLGVFSAAKDNNKYVIGVDSDQDYLAEGIILTSMMKNIDVGLDIVISEIINSGFKNKAYKFGIKENGVGLSQMLYTKDKISPATLDKLTEIESLLVNKAIKVPTLFKDE